jgi:hypothetical protein
MPTTKARARAHPNRLSGGALMENHLVVLPCHPDAMQCEHDDRNADNARV